jgi:ribonuclease HI
MAEAAERVVYCDGSCLGNPGPGGWAWAVPGGPYASGAEARSTNQRMEITAALMALGAQRHLGNSGSLVVVSDSAYVVNCFSQRWWAGWRQRGWRNARGKPVANRELWEPLIELALDPAWSVAFRWVKGHSGDYWNELVDQLAVSAAVSGHGTSGSNAR